MWVKGSFVPTSSRRGALLCDYNGLLLKGDEASAHLKRCEANLSYDTFIYYVQILREILRGGLAR